MRLFILGIGSTCCWHNWPWAFASDTFVIAFAIMYIYSWSSTCPFGTRHLRSSCSSQKLYPSCWFNALNRPQCQGFFLFELVLYHMLHRKLRHLLGWLLCISAYNARGLSSPIIVPTPLPPPSHYNYTLITIIINQEVNFVCDGDKNGRRRSARQLTDLECIIN